VAKAASAFYSFFSQLKQTAIDVFLPFSIAVAFKQLRKYSLNLNCFSIISWIAIENQR